MILASRHSLQRHEQLNQAVVLHSTSLHLSDGPAELSDLMLSGTGSCQQTRTLLRANNVETYMIWLFEVGKSRSWEVEDASAHLKSFLYGQSESATTFLYSQRNKIEGRETTNSTYLATILNTKSDTFRSLSLSSAERHSLEYSCTEPVQNPKHAHRMLFCKLAALISSLLLFLFAATILLVHRHNASQPDLWMHWNTNGSDGPQYQLQFTSPHPDFNSWAKEAKKEGTSYFVRLDDQSMVPEHLIDDT